MKSLEELKAIRDKMKGQIGMRSEDDDNIRVVVRNGYLRDRQWSKTGTDGAL